MALSVVTRRSIRDVESRDWSAVCGDGNDLLMHPSFLQAAEAAMGPGAAGARSSGVSTEFWYLVAYDDGVPVGAACVTEFPLDTMVFASPLAHRVVGVVRCIFPRYLKFRVTWCGLPISTAGSNLRVTAGADADRVVSALNDAVEAISRERKTWLIVYKELNATEADRASALERSGYVRAESLPMNRIVNRFNDYAAMLAAMRSHYRYKIVKSRKKLATSGAVVRRIVGRDAVEAVYTPALHAMYERVTCRSEHRLEILPREFFFELAERFPTELILTTIELDSKVIAFAWSLRLGSVYRNLFVGIDDAENAESDAYFNLMVEDIEHALSEPVDEIWVGQTADDFKSRLGCTADPRYLFIKLTNSFLSWWFHKMQGTFLTPPPTSPAREVFRQEATAELPAETA